MNRNEAQAQCILTWKLVTPAAVRAALFEASKDEQIDLCDVLIRYHKLTKAQGDQVRKAVEFAINSGRLVLNAKNPRVVSPASAEKLIEKTNDLIATLRVARPGQSDPAPPAKQRSAESLSDDKVFQDRLSTIRLEKSGVQQLTQSDSSITEAPKASEDQFLGLKFSKFKILAEIASGAMGIIFRAWSHQHRKVVALKLLFDDEDYTSNLFARFRREAKVLQKLDHPHIVRVIDHGYEEDKQPYLAMEFIVGKNLRDLVEHSMKTTGRPLQIDTVVRNLLPISMALKYCHSRGVIHRDVKPTNVVVENASGRSILVDFGLVKRDAELLGTSVHASLSKRGEILGTPAYMSPEQVGMTGIPDITEAVDVWGLGATIFYCLSGETPYQATNAMSTYLALMTREPRTLKEVWPQAPAWANDLCGQCLQRDVSKRLPLDTVIETLRAHQ